MTVLLRVWFGFEHILEVKNRPLPRIMQSVETRDGRTLETLWVLDEKEKVDGMLVYALEECAALETKRRVK